MSKLIDVQVWLDKIEQLGVPEDAWDELLEHLEFFHDFYLSAKNYVPRPYPANEDLEFEEVDGVFYLDGIRVSEKFRTDK